MLILKVFGNGQLKIRKFSGLKFGIFTKIKGTKGKRIIKKNKVFYKNIFFPESKLNYSENLLPKQNDEIAINFFRKRHKKEITWNKLYESVCKFSSLFKKNKFKRKR